MTKITEEHVHSMISEQEFTKMGQKTTVCVTRLVNGFEIVTSAACVDPADYCDDTGRDICMKRAIEKIWELEGYVSQVGLACQEATNMETEDGTKCDSELQGEDKAISC